MTKEEAKKIAWLRPQAGKPAPAMWEVLKPVKPPVKKIICQGCRAKFSYQPDRLLLGEISLVACPKCGETVKLKWYDDFDDYETRFLARLANHVLNTICELKRKEATHEKR